MQIWVSNLSTDDQSIAVSKSEDDWHYSFTMLWNQYTSVIYKYYYYYLQEKKMSYMNDLKVTVCVWLSSDFYLTCMHCLVSMKRALKCKKKTNHLQQMSACSSLPSKQSSSPSQRQRSWIQRLLLHWNCSALHNCGGISPCLTTKNIQDAHITCQLDTYRILPLHV